MSWDRNCREGALWSAPSFRVRSWRNEHQELLIDIRISFLESFYSNLQHHSIIMTSKIRRVNNLSFIIWRFDSDIEIDRKVISKFADKSLSLISHQHDTIQTQNNVQEEWSSQRTITKFTKTVIEKDFHKHVASSNDQSSSESSESSESNEYFVFRSLAQFDVELHTDIEVILWIILDYMRNLHTLRHSIEAIIDTLHVTRIHFSISAW